MNWKNPRVRWYQSPYMTSFFVGVAFIGTLALVLLLMMWARG